MTTTIIIIICVLLLLAYIFDITASKTKIPSVILLLTLGYGFKQATSFFQVPIPNLTSILPVLGTVGLILIVLEGSLELEIDRSKLPFIGKTALMALVPMLLFSFGFAYLIQYIYDIPLKIALTNAIPLAIISSAIAIPSAQPLPAKQREFITYESSLSDIFGVIFFNFISLNDNINTQSVYTFIIEILLILVVTFIATVALAFLLSKIKHHVKYAPIILMVVLIYAIAKIYHLPALIFILLFGLFLGNLDIFRENHYIQKLHPEILNREVHKFKDLTTEIAFLIRALFFLLFGFLIQTQELLNAQTIVWSLGIVTSIFLLRFLLVKIFGLSVVPLGFIAPRGLITILLFLNIPAALNMELVDKSLIIQVILLSAMVMMMGLLLNKTAVQQEEDTTSKEVPAIISPDSDLPEYH